MSPSKREMIRADIETYTRPERNEFSFCPVKINAQKRNPEKGSIALQRFVRLTPIYRSKHDNRNPVRLNILIGGRKMKCVFLVLHVYELLPQEEETFKIIGAYETKKDAQVAIRRKRRCLGFRDHPKGFHIYQLELGKEQWSGGFDTYFYTPKKGP